MDEEYIKECISVTLDNYEGDHHVPGDLIAEMAGDLISSIDNYSLGCIPTENPKEAELSSLKDSHRHEIEYNEKHYEGKLKEKDDTISQLRNRIYDLKHQLGM